MRDVCGRGARGRCRRRSASQMQGKRWTLEERSGGSRHAMSAGPRHVSRCAGRQPVPSYAQPQHDATTSQHPPTWSPMARAVRQLSPVSSTQCMPITCSAATTPLHRKACDAGSGRVQVSVCASASATDGSA